MAIDSLPPEELRELASAVRHERVAFDVLRAKRENVQTVRVRVEGDRTVVLKMWDVSGVIAAIRARLRTTNAEREWTALRRLHEAGVSVPAPLGRARLEEGDGAFDVIAVEDLGACVRAGDVLSSLVADGADDEIATITDGFIEIMAGMVASGVLDTDNTTTNYLLPPGAAPVRVDLELARVVTRPEKQPKLYGTMLGRLMASYTFAVHAEPERAAAFLGRIVDRLRPSPAVVSGALTCLREGLERHGRETGIAVDLDQTIRDLSGSAPD